MRQWFQHSSTAYDEWLACGSDVPHCTMLRARASSPAVLPGTTPLPILADCDSFVGASAPVCGSAGTDPELIGGATSAMLVPCHAKQQTTVPNGPALAVHAAAAPVAGDVVRHLGCSLKTVPKARDKAFSTGCLPQTRSTRNPQRTSPWQSISFSIDILPLGLVKRTRPCHALRT